MPSTGFSTDAGSSSSEESEKMVHSRSHDPSQAIPRIPPPSSSGSESDDDSDAVTPPSKTHQQQEQQTQKQKKEQPPPTSPSPSALLSNKTAATKILAKRPSVQSRSPAPSQARPIPPPSSSDASSDDDSEAPTPLPKTHQQQEQKKKQQLQKQKKEQPLPPSPSQSQSPSPSPSSSALHSNKTPATKTSAKRSREEESNGIPEPPSTKKKMKGQIVQHSDEVPAKEKKKAQKQNVAEALSTPSSPQKSGKKVVQVWNSKDELAFLNGLLAFTKGCKEFPKNMSPVYDYVRNMMDIHYSNKQFGDKLRRLKAKFWSLVENRRANDYNFKSTDEAATYKLCEQLWGVQDEGDDGDDEHYHIAETEGNASMPGKEKKKKKKKQPVEAEDEYEAKTKDGEDQGQEEEEDLKKIKDGEDQGDEEEGGQDETTRNKTMANGLVKCNEGDLERISRELYSKLSKERDDIINEMKHTMVKSLEESQAKTMAMAQDFLLKESQTKTRAMVQDHLLNPRAGQVQLPFSDTMTGILSGRWAPVPNREALEEKWRTQQIVEMEAFSGRLDLMREECKMCLEELRASASSDRS